ncbi:hypothetical protein [Butyrivibrio sp. AE2032]|uniref:hypothetical protein n=1 Tax=Butyrivibrio sp. AE2032 TaxID=1458463 RepID=UPI00054CECA2|nr:hypothetical protein [Butyrivibrio sp. AE2032]
MKTNNEIRTEQLDIVAGGKRKYAPSGVNLEGNDVLRANLMGNDVLRLTKADVDPEFDPIFPHA